MILTLVLCVVAFCVGHVVGGVRVANERATIIRELLTASEKDASDILRLAREGWRKDHP